MNERSIDDVLHDMTALNNELINTQRDLTKKNAEIERLNIQLEKSNTDLRQFASIVSHNLRAPVRNIVGLSNILQSEPTDDQRIRAQAHMFKAVGLLNELIEDLSKILKSKSDVSEADEIINFEQLVDKITSSIENLLQEENVQISTDFTGIENISSNKNYIHSIFYNFISNSIKYKHASRAPVIKIWSEVQGDKVILRFKDNGAGIDMKKNGDQLFGLYKRFDRQKEGKGLGLFMVKTQIESLGGNIRAESVFGEGIEFIVELPLSTRL